MARLILHISTRKKIIVEMEEVLGRERRYVNRLIQDSKIYHLLALVGIVSLSVLTMLFLIFNVNRPLKTIENGIHKTVEGDYKHIPAISTGDEFESLVTSLNHVISELNRKQHGGRIEVKSEVGQGTVFTVYLPSGQDRGNNEE